jgi:simple sugar transport system permease protein
VAVAAFVFGAASALQFAFQAMGWHVPYQIFLVTPYLLTLAGLISTVGRARSPAALGKVL